MFDYSNDVLANGHAPRQPRTVPLRRGLVIEVLGDGFVGTVTGLRGDRVVLVDRRGRERTFALGDGTGFVVGDESVRLEPPAPPARPTAAPATTRSGSLAAPRQPARVARASRILVEGMHDAELVEKIWGDDLRVEGVVVEVMGGIDDLRDLVRAFAPGPQRRLGVLVDHLLDGTKEERVARDLRSPHVLVTGHPFVDIWAAIKPSAAGIDAWPDVPRDEVWKDGICRRLGVGDPATFWRQLLASITTYTDLDRRLVGAVEALIDFVTAPEA